MCAYSDIELSGDEEGACVIVWVKGKGEGGLSRELNSLVLTHIDIKFTAILSFIQVVINL